MATALVDSNMYLDWPSFSLAGTLMSIDKVTGMTTKNREGKSETNEKIYYRLKVKTELGSAHLLYFGESATLETLPTECFYLFQGTINFRSGIWLSCRKIWKHEASSEVQIDL